MPVQSVLFARPTFNATVYVTRYAPQEVKISVKIHVSEITRMQY